jgi:hypothetical protein
MFGMTKPKKIESLTEAQIARFPYYVEKWLSIGLSNETDKPKAEEAICRVYQCAGLKPPKLVIWLGSPRAGAIGATLLKQTKIAGTQVAAQVAAEVWDQVRNQVLAEVGDQVGNQVLAEVTAQVWGQVAAQVAAEVWVQVRNQVWAQVRAQVGNQVGNQVLAEVTAQVGNQVGVAGYGSQDAGWLSFYDFMKAELQLASCNKLDGLFELSKYCGWFWPFAGAVILTEKPTEIHLRERRLHCDGGPAILYRDGFAVHALNGVLVPAWLAETPIDKLDPNEVMKLTNAEQRKEGIAKIGIPNMREALKVEVIHTFKDYELWTIEFEGRRIGPYLKMVNDSTGQIHVEGVGEVTGGVDLDIKTCQDALAWRGNFKVFSEAKWTA